MVCFLKTDFFVVIYSWFCNPVSTSIVYFVCQTFDSLEQKQSITYRFLYASHNNHYKSWDKNYNALTWHTYNQIKNFVR